MNPILLQCYEGAVKILKCGCDHTDAALADNEIAITGIICGTFAIVALIVSFTILKWKSKQIQAESQKRQEDKTKEQNEIDRKQKANILDKKLELLHELCYEKKGDSKDKVMKKYDSDEMKNYLAVLDQLLTSV